MPRDSGSRLGNGFLAPLGRAAEQHGGVVPDRMLFTCRPLAGHFEPLVSLARAAKASGHVVAFATGEPYASRARQAGFEAFRAGPGEDFRTEWAPRFPGFDRLVGDAQRHFFLTEIFANLELAPRADDLEIIVENWRPQLLVHEVAELAAPLVGSAHGLAYVDVSYGALIGSSLLRAAGEAAAPHWRARGLEPHAVAGLFRYLYVDTCPPSLQNPEIASISAVQLLRPAAAELPDADPPEWLDRLSSAAAIVYLTMGTVWNQDLDIFRSVISAIRDEDIALIITVGRQNDPASLGPPGANVVVRQYIPQGVLLPRCDAVVTHGGAGTTLGALAFGVPLLVLPQGADQYANAERVVAAGAGRQLFKHELSVTAIRGALLDVLRDASYRRSARRLQAEIREMPDAHQAVKRIETLRSQHS
ncbi:MAG: nucleotide disphospho-sugar-binding domain-containing protein [Ilumatobacteraceae bacterium]